MTMKSIPVVTASRARGAFTLAELLVSVAVVTAIVFMVAQLMNSATTVTRAGNKHIDTDTQARVVFDRMALDFAQMLKRTDIDYYIKQPTGYNGHGNGHGWGNKVQTGQQGSDQIAFFSQVPGYNYAGGSQSPVSLVAYRVNADSPSRYYLKLERMGKGLLWNGVSNLTSNNNNNVNITYPIVFLPQTIAGTGPWSAAVNNDGSNASDDKQGDYETIGPQVFRFEYYYLLKNGSLTDVPWDTAARPTQTTLANPISIGLVDVEAIGVAIAVIDPAGRSLISASSLSDLASDMADFKSAPGRGNGGAKKTGDVEAQWESVVETVATTGKTSSNSLVPRAAASAIRIYSRYFDLKTF
jgi:hypothetical protein